LAIAEQLLYHFQSKLGFLEKTEVTCRAGSNGFWRSFRRGRISKKFKLVL